MENKIEKHKNSINKILNNHIKNAYKCILNLLEGEKNKGELTIDEFEELKEYLKQKQNELEQSVNYKNLENIENVEIKDIEKTNSEYSNDFKQSLKIEGKELKFVPIYKGKMGKLPPERNEK